MESSKLQEYNQKRDFTKTGEPAGKAAKPRGEKLRFAVQHHAASHDHYDLRLEWNGVLKSWAVPKGPSYNPRDKRLAVQVEDHPLDYRDFEGTIPKGEYGGGTVMLWDEGTWRPLLDDTDGFRDGQLKFELDGSRLKGSWALVHMKPKDGEKDKNWLLIKEKDEYANAYDTHYFASSIKTGLTMGEIAAEGGEEASDAGAGKKAIKTKAEKGRVKPAADTKKATGGAPITDGPSFVYPTLKDIRLTSPEKALYKDPTITKEDIARHYITVAKRMMPFVQNRVLSTVRCPDGIGSACFFKKHPAYEGRGVVTIPVPPQEGKQADKASGKAGDKAKNEQYLFVANAFGLLSEVQMNTLEFHTWGSRVEALEKPDVMVFDLDPDEGLALADIRQGVRDLKGLLDELNLVSFLKTSGGKGYHVVVPFVPETGWEPFYAFAQNIAKTMEATWPDRYTSNMRKASRKGRIFIDWIRNGRGATSVAPYSVRARKGAPVSMPIPWRELDTVAPDGITIQDMKVWLRRKDPWEGFYKTGQSLH